MNRLTRWINSRRLANLKQQRAGIKSWLAYVQHPSMIPSAHSVGIIAESHKILGEIEEKIRQLEGK